MRIAVTGPRRGVPSVFVEVCLATEIPWEPTMLLHGGAAGVDTAAGKWWLRRNCQPVIFPAYWKEHGLAAGPMRNRTMLENAQALVAFLPDWPSPGTENCVRQALRMGLPLFIRRYHGPVPTPTPCRKT